VLGIGALLLGWGIVGLATAATVTTLLTAVVFRRILSRDFPGLRVEPQSLRLDRDAGASLLRAGWPLMLNALLVGLFFRADQFVIKASAGGQGAGIPEAERERASTLEVERYQAAYSFLNFVLLITPAVTLALFPRMARHAATDRPRLASEYAFALKVLLVISVPIVALTVWFAPLLVSVLTGGKAEYLPESAVALQILIFFLPLSFINGVTQYVLIALDLQRLITRAFAATVVFNLAANLVLVPLMGINGAAIATILSEMVLLGPFLVWTGRQIGRVPLLSLALKPLLAAAPVALLGWLLLPVAQGWSSGWGELALYVGGGLLLLLVYTGALLLVRPFSEEERSTLRRALRRN
jgi:O-antigen/teichoic acid export membrane protein